MTLELPHDIHGARPTDALKILIVDDSRLQRRILLNALGQSGHHLFEAGSGDEALRMCHSEQFDIVLSDWIMPGLTGIDLCAAIRAQITTHYIYFIILTSKSAKEELAQALRLGADDFLSKPLSRDELLGRIAAGERLLRMGRALRENNRLISSTLERMREMNDSLDRDLAEARKFQLALSPCKPVKRGGWTISFTMQPSGHVGGDLIGTFPAGPDRLGVYCLDVSGHGVTSALIGARLASWLSSAAPDRNVALTGNDGTARMLPPEQVCARLNARFLHEIDTGHYFTALIGELDLSTGAFVYAQAGHPHPFLQTAWNDGQFIGNGGAPIGLIEDVEFSAQSVAIPIGGRLLIYSDGVTDCASANGDMLGEDGLVRFMLDNACLTGDGFLDRLQSGLGAHAGDADLTDDVSAILIERDWSAAIARVTKVAPPRLATRAGASDALTQTGT